MRVKMLISYILPFTIILSIAKVNAQDKVFQCSSPKITIEPLKTIEISSKISLKLKQIIFFDSTAFPDRLSYSQIFEFYKEDTLKPMQTITDSGHYFHEYEFIDINSDGHNDLRIEDDMYDLYCPSSYWIFNPKTGLFEYSDILSGISELSSDNGVFSTQNLSLGGRGGYYSKFIIQDGKRKDIETVNSNYFDYEKKILVNGELTVVEQDKDDFIGVLDGDIHTITSQRIVFDSLRIVEKYVLKDFENKRISDDIDPTILRSEPFGNFIYLEDVTYDYKHQPDGALQIEKTTRKVVNNKWVTIKKKIIKRK
jgi:hypothetical protein